MGDICLGEPEKKWEPMQHSQERLIQETNNDFNLSFSANVQDCRVKKQVLEKECYNLGQQISEGKKQFLKECGSQGKMQDIPWDVCYVSAFTRMF